MIKKLRNLALDKSGATAIEYGLIVSLIVIAIVTSMSTVANESTQLWTTITQKSQEAIDSN